MTIPASRRDELRRLVVVVRERNRSIKFGDPRYSCVVGSEELLALVTAVPDLLDEIERLEAQRADDVMVWFATESDLAHSHRRADAAEAEIVRLRTELGEAKLVIEQQGRDLDDLGHPRKAP